MFLPLNEAGWDDMAELTQREKFKSQLKASASETAIPMPPVPKLPEQFVSNRPPDQQEALRQYNTQWEAYFKAVENRKK